MMIADWQTVTKDLELIKSVAATIPENIDRDWLGFVRLASCGINELCDHALDVIAELAEEAVNDGANQGA